MMMIGGSCSVHQWRPFSRFKALCSAYPPEGADELRHKLERVLAEAESSRAKASSSRLRLMRLSEAAEKLTRQAADSLRRGKENDAREVLFQKKKLMQVMEKLKIRIRTLDELSAKLNEAMSVYEQIMMQNLAMNLDLGEVEEAPSPVRVISPTNEDPTNDSCSHEQSSVQRSWNHDEAPNKLPSYSEFIEHVDQQVKKIEEEFIAFFENRDIAELQDTLTAAEILESIRHLRERIAASKVKAQA